MKSSGVEVDVISHKRQRYAVWFGGSLMASLVRPYLYPAADYSLTYRRFDHPARILHLLSHEGAVRRDRS